MENYNPVESIAFIFKFTYPLGHSEYLSSRVETQQRQLHKDLDKASQQKHTLFATMVWLDKRT